MDAVFLPRHMPSLSCSLNLLWEVCKHTSQSSFVLRCVFAHFSKQIQWVGKWEHMPSKAKKNFTLDSVHRDQPNDSYSTGRPVVGFWSWQRRSAATPTHLQGAFFYFLSFWSPSLRPSPRTYSYSGPNKLPLFSLFLNLKYPKTIGTVPLVNMICS